MKPEHIVLISLEGRCTYSYAIGADVLKQKSHLICESTHAQEQNCTVIIFFLFSTGEIPQSRPGYQLPEPNGCSSSLVGFQLDMGIPAMTKCCDQLDMCYDTCGASKYDCDTKFRSCLHDICSDVNKSLGFVSKVEACESMADTLFNTVWTLGCRPYMNSQRAACVCAGEERDEL
nr:group XIIB secretory phospholipase A2-like protein isoform X2 [Labrus bergylta]